MTIEKNMLIKNANALPMATDIFFEATGHPKPVIIYAHGFNGFKDWGNFDLIAKRFAAAGFVFIKFNFANNGTTPEHPEAFVDLDAYAANSYTKELDDLGTIINWATDPAHTYAPEIDSSKIGLLGHSLGGGIAILKAAEDVRIRALTTWASIAECQTPWGSWPDARMQEWKEAGVQYIANSRTGQQMPLGYQLYENFERNKDRLNIEQAISSLHIPVLLCHGTADLAVPVAKAYLLQQWLPSAKIFIVDSDHVFGRKHPWTSNALPEAADEVLNATIDFFRDGLNR